MADSRPRKPHIVAAWTNHLASVPGLPILFGVTFLAIAFLRERLDCHCLPQGPQPVHRAPEEQGCQGNATGHVQFVKSC